MRKLVAFVTIVLGLFSSEKVVNAQDVKDVEIQLKVKDYPNAPVVLGYYYNKQMLVRDTIWTDANCRATYSRDTLLDEGVYMLYIPDHNMMDVMITGNQHFSIECDTLKNMLQRAKTSGNEPLKTFISYQKYLQEMQGKYQTLSNDFKQAKQQGDTARQSSIRRTYNALDKEVKDKNKAIIEANKDNFLSVFLTSLREVEFPKFNIPSSVANADSLKQVYGYYWYRKNWDMHYNFADKRLLFTPFFIQKVDDYLDKSVPHVADSVAEECIRIIEKARPDSVAFRYWVSHLYNKVNDSKIMGMDGALVRIADRYYLSGEAKWTTKKFIDDLREQVDGIRYTLVGLKAKDIKVPSITGEWFRLHEVDAPYTILVFWEPSCGHCKKEIPELKEKVWEPYKKYGIKIFAVYCQVEREEWESFVEEHQLEEWINVYDPYGRSGFRQYYNIKSTPQIFVLDKDKTIIAKRIGVDQLPDFFDHYLNLNK
ncbi:MAG: TlpA disulfide reductase family protein [Bacteroidia bacterium]|nr:TlpA disulfide reductase family protein [Bacteroidia bacterium]